MTEAGGGLRDLLRRWRPVASRGRAAAFSASSLASSFAEPMCSISRDRAWCGLRGRRSAR